MPVRGWRDPNTPILLSPGAGVAGVGGGGGGYWGNRFTFEGIADALQPTARPCTWRKTTVQAQKKLH
jgi:hypothetical protein